MNRQAAVRLCALLCTGIATSALAGCASPEADRVRGGDAGADPGNRDAVVRMHEGSRMYHDVPCEMTVECNGPEPVFGLPELDGDSND